MVQPKYETSPSIFSVMSELSQKENAINLSQGFPDFSVDKNLIGFVEKAMKDGWNQYVPMPGLPKLRREVTQLIFNHYRRELNENDNITITAGATQGIFDIITAMVRPGKKVIILDPSYDCYAPAVIANGGIPVHVNLSYPDYDLDFGILENIIDQDCVLLIFNNPHNPTGHVFDKDFILKLRNVILENPQLYLLSDEVYEHIHFKEFHSIIEFDELFERSFVVSSFGKTFHATGWKMGYITAPKYLTQIVRGIHQYMVFSVNSAMQKGLADYIESINHQVEIKSLYHKKRDTFLNGLKNSRFIAKPSDGSYFQTLDYSKIDEEKDDTEMAKEITIQHKVASVPTSVFFKDQTDRKLLRFCFAKDDETLIKATEILCKI